MRAYASILVGMLVAGCALHLSCDFVLYRASELTPLDALIARQQATDGLYFGLANPAASYKLAAYAVRKPDIVILGSSRAHREHQEFYNRSSYSMSGLVVSPEAAVQVVRIAIPLHKPKVVIFNVDFFSFCDSGSIPDSARAQLRHTVTPQGDAWQPVNSFTLLPKLVARQVVSTQELADIALGRFNDAPNGIALFGLTAIRLGMGFRLDGSVQAIEARTQAANALDAGKQAILAGTGRFSSDCQYSPDAVAHLDLLQREMDEAGIELIILLPPIAPSLYRMFMAAPAAISGYLVTTRRELARRGFSDFHDLLDGDAVGALDSEFSDAIHGGDVSEARMLLKAAEAPATHLAEIVNRPFIERLVRERAGMLTAGFPYFRSAVATAGSAAAAR
jgi:hypothetical protein